MCRGYYGRSVLAAWDWRDRQLRLRWVFDSKDGENPYSGQGGHQLSVADVDADGRPCRLNPRATSPALTLPGTKVISISDARFPTRPLFEGKVPPGDSNLYFSIQPGFPPPRLRLQSLPAPPSKDQ